MANEIALAVHCRPGEEVLCGATSRIIGVEGGGPAALTGVMIQPLLDHHVARLAEDHANARRLAQGLVDLRGVGLDAGSIETNLVYFDVAATGMDAAAFVAAAAREGVRMTGMGATRVRAVTHLDVDAAAVERALLALARVCGC